jgi:hypothetical protein
MLSLAGYAMTRFLKYFGRHIRNLVKDDVFCGFLKYDVICVFIWLAASESSVAAADLIPLIMDNSKNRTRSHAGSVTTATEKFSDPCNVSLLNFM